MLFANLQTLTMASCGLTELPNFLGALEALTSLDASHNRLSTLPASPKLWPDILKVLTLGDNRFADFEHALPDSLRTLEWLLGAEPDANDLKAHEAVAAAAGGGSGAPPPRLLCDAERLLRAGRELGRLEKLRASGAALVPVAAAAARADACRATLVEKSLSCLAAALHLGAAKERPIYIGPALDAALPPPPEPIAAADDAAAPAAAAAGEPAAAPAVRTAAAAAAAAAIRAPFAPNVYLAALSPRLTKLAAEKAGRFAAWV